MSTGNHITMTYAEYMAGGLGRAMMKWEINESTKITITDCPEFAIREMEEAGIGARREDSSDKLN